MPNQTRHRRWSQLLERVVGGRTAGVGFAAAGEGESHERERVVEECASECDS